MKHKFKPGDIVECIDNANYEELLTINGLYKVTGYDCDDLLQLEGVRYVCFDERFDLVEKNSIPESYGIVSDGVMQPSLFLIAKEAINYGQSLGKAFSLFSFKFEKKFEPKILVKTSTIWEESSVW